jgi:hypothetical protein
VTSAILLLTRHPLRHRDQIDTEWRRASHTRRRAEFEKDAAAGTLADFSLIEPNLLAGHGDCHPAVSRALDTVDIPLDNPSSTLGGEAFLERVYTAYRSATSATGANVWNTPPADRVGRARRHCARGGDWVRRSPSATPRPAASITSFSLDAPRDPDTWATIKAQPVPDWAMDPEEMGKALSTLGIGAGSAITARARELGVPLPPEATDPGASLPPRLIGSVLRDIAHHFFPLLAVEAKDPG